MNNDIELAQVTLDQDYEKDQKKFSCEEVTSNVSPKGRYKAKRLYKLFFPETLNLQKWPWVKSMLHAEIASIFVYKKGTDSTQYAISFQWPWTCQIVHGSNYDTGSGHEQSLCELRISNVSK